MKKMQVDGALVDSAWVETYQILPGARKVKVATTAERYAFSKDAYARGGEGRIFAARELHTKEPYCIKEIRLKTPKKSGKPGASVVDWKDIAERATAEVEHAWMVSRSFGPTRLFTNKKRSKFYIVQKPMSGQVSTVVDKLSERVGRPAALTFVALTVAEDVKAIHDAQILHFDIKPANLCYNKKEMTIELLDFGLSVKGRSGFSEGTSAAYSPPEQLLQSRLDRSADVFALGTTFAELALQRRLFQDPSARFDAKDLSDAVNGRSEDQGAIDHYRRYENDLRRFSPELGTLFSEMMDLEPKRRPNMEAIVQRLQKIQISAEEKQLMARAWQELPDVDPKMDRILDSLDKSLQRIREAKLTPVSYK